MRRPELRVSDHPAPTLLRAIEKDKELESKRITALYMFQKALTLLLANTKRQCPPLSFQEEDAELDKLSQAFLWYAKEWMQQYGSKRQDDTSFPITIRYFPCPDQAWNFSTEYYSEHALLRLATVIHNIRAYSFVLRQHRRFPTIVILETSMLPELVDYLNYTQLIKPRKGPPVFQPNARFAFFPLPDSPPNFLVPPELTGTITHQPTSDPQNEQEPPLQDDNLLHIAQSEADQAQYDSSESIITTTKEELIP